MTDTSSYFSILLISKNFQFNKLAVLWAFIFFGFFEFFNSSLKDEFLQKFNNKLSFFDDDFFVVKFFNNFLNVVDVVGPFL